MIIQRLATGIKNQDWFVVMVEVMIVVVGVYLGIFIGEAATQKNLKKDARISLELLAEDLKSDQEYLKRVLDINREVITTYKKAINVLKTDPLDLEKAKVAIIAVHDTNTPTFYPNRSTYQVMLSKGQLDVLGNYDLRQKITKLYEMSYLRSQENGVLYGQNIDATFMNYFTQYYDPTTNFIIATSVTDFARFRAGLNNQKGYFEWYLSVMVVDVKAPLEEVIGVIESYMEANPT